MSAPTDIDGLADLEAWLTGGRVHVPAAPDPVLPRLARGPRRWPLAVIASPAAVAIWSGWVGLGGLCGFGIVHPLPGIVDSFAINSAITLPVGVEAYGAWALSAWLRPGAARRARKFAGWSALGALVLGMAGQVAYHLLAAADYTRAPWGVTLAVACVPVVTFGCAAALAHLLHAAPEPEPVPVPDPDTDVPGPPAALNGHAHEAAAIFADDLEAGRVPGVRPIRRKMRVGQERAQQVRAYLEGIVALNGGHRG